MDGEIAGTEETDGIDGTGGIEDGVSDGTMDGITLHIAVGEVTTGEVGETTITLTAHQDTLVITEISIMVLVTTGILIIMLHHQILKESTMDLEKMVLGQHLQMEDQSLQDLEELKMVL